MQEKLTWDEIRKQYDGEWVLLDNCEWPEESIDPVSGVVRFHAKDRRDFDQKLESLEPGFDSAIVYVGIPPVRPDVVITRGYNQIVLSD